jgi:type I restriction enzyme S subunit
MKQGWEVKKLGEICEIELGKTPYRGNKSFWDVEKSSNNIWLSIADLLNTDGDVVSDSKEYITDEAAKISKIVKKGTLLLSFKLTLGRMAFAGKDLFTNEAIAALTIKDDKEIDKYFLYQFLSLFDWNLATDGDVKVKGRTLNKAKLKEIEIHFPKSLPEQQRIVAILDEAFAAIEGAKANAALNLKNAKELFDSYLQSVFEDRGEGWEEKRLVDVCIVERGSSPRPIAKYQTNSLDGVNWIKIGDAKRVDKYIYSTKEKITKEGAEKSRYVKEGDFILSNSMSFGKPFIMKTDGYIHDGWFVLRLHEFIDTEYFLIFFLRLMLMSSFISWQVVQ